MNVYVTEFMIKILKHDWNVFTLQSKNSNMISTLTTLSA